ncbi:MAG: hypothetical protein QME59_00880 [Candidatus Hydrothermarchaeota archaeon]|nr:hypothetical protein [Candidatus Hydrothermarchaeota archaeon]
MSIKSSEKVRAEIKSLYNRNPKKWHVLVGRDSRGYTSTIILHADKMWMLKEEQINPYETVGCGLRIEEIDKSLRPFLRDPHSFGFRPVSEERIRDILEADVSDKVIRKILRKEPVAADRITSPAIVGPITLPTRQIDFVSEKQRKLDAELGKELDRMIYKKRPDIFLPYV